MKNITVSLDDESYRRARVKAAEAGRSVSAMVREFLQKIGTEESEFERLERQEQELYAKIDAANRGLGSSPRMTRDELYEEMLSERSR